MSLGLDLLGTISPLLPRFDEVDGVVVTAGTFIIPLAASAASMGIWVPFGTIAMCLGVLGPFYLTSLLFKIARVLVAHFPLIGGKG